MAKSFVCIHCGGTAFRLPAAGGNREAECIACGKSTPIIGDDAASPDESKVAKMIVPVRLG